MMNTYKLIVVTVLSLLFFLTNSLVAEDVIHGCKRIDEKGSCTLYSVSLIALIANPLRYDGKRIRVMGYVHQEFEANALYVSEYDHTHALTKNALWLDSFLKDINDHVVLIEGTFRASNQGHRGMFSGAIESITRSMRWPPQALKRNP